MLKLWQFLVTGCWHRWEEYQRGPFERRNSDGTPWKSGHYASYRCPKCGMLKREVDV